MERICTTDRLPVAGPSQEPSPYLTVQAFGFALDATADQEASIRRHFGARRYTYNWTVAEIRRELDLYRECGVSFGPPSLARLRKRWNCDRHRLTVDVDGNPWWPEVSKEAFSNGIADAVTAYWNLQKGRAGEQSGRRPGFPRFCRKGRDSDRFRVTTGSFGVCDRRHVKLPRIGRVRTHENTRRLHRLLELNRARLLNVTVRRRGSRLLAVFVVELCGPSATQALPFLTRWSVWMSVCDTLLRWQIGTGRSSGGWRTLAPSIAISHDSGAFIEHDRDARRALCATDEGPRRSRS